MPHQVYAPTGRLEAQVDHPAGASFDSTHFDERSPNPLYHTSDDFHFPINAELKMSFDSDYFGQTPDGSDVGYIPATMVPPVGNLGSVNS